MESTKRRLKRLEESTRLLYPLPSVVEQAEGESAQDSIERALNDRPAPDNWKFVLCPSPLTLSQWEAKYPP